MKYLLGEISYIELVNISIESKFLIMKKLLVFVNIVKEKVNKVIINIIINSFEKENFSLDAILVMYINKISIPPTITKNNK